MTGKYARAYNGEHANCSNCYYRTVAKTCTMARLGQYGYRCKHWKDDLGAGFPSKFIPADPKP